MPEGRERSLRHTRKYFPSPQTDSPHPIRLTSMQTPTPITFARAKRLRKDMTRAERVLWFQLRAKRLEKHKFYRQMPVGPYIVDFVNKRHQLIIEVDGATHGDDHEMDYDARRTAYLEQLGFRVLRVTNLEVYETMDVVVERILQALREA